MRIPIAPQIAAWYATRLCEFANLNLSRGWRSLFFDKTKDDTGQEFKKAMRGQIGKISRTRLQKLSLGEVISEVINNRFPPPCNKTFHAVQELQEEAKGFLRKTAADHELLRLHREAKLKESLLQMPSSSFQSLPSQVLSLSISASRTSEGDHSIDIKSNDLRSELHLLYALALDARIGRCACRCKRFFVVKRRGEKSYYSSKCAEKITAKERVRGYRERRAKWKKVKEVLSQLLADIDAIEQKQRLQRPRSERQVLEESEKALDKARTAFEKAYPRQEGQGYEEGKAFLTNAEKRVLKLRKRVRGY
jgi:hypothetical protein